MTLNGLKHFMSKNIVAFKINVKYFYKKGQVVEWLKALVSKTGIRVYRIEGSNPSLSAKKIIFDTLINPTFNQPHQPH